MNLKAQRSGQKKFGNVELNIKVWNVYMILHFRKLLNKSN